MFLKYWSFVAFQQKKKIMELFPMIIWKFGNNHFFTTSILFRLLDKAYQALTFYLLHRAVLVFAPLLGLPVPFQGTLALSQDMLQSTKPVKKYPDTKQICQDSVYTLKCPIRTKLLKLLIIQL